MCEHGDIAVIMLIIMLIVMLIMILTAMLIIITTIIILFKKCSYKIPSLDETGCNVQVQTQANILQYIHSCIHTLEEQEPKIMGKD